MGGMRAYNNRGEPLLKLNYPPTWSDWKNRLRQRGLSGLRVVRLGWDALERWYVIETIDDRERVYRARVSWFASPAEVATAEWKRRGMIGWDQDVVTW